MNRIEIRIFLSSWGGATAGADPPLRRVLELSPSFRLVLSDAVGFRASPCFDFLP